METRLVKRLRKENGELRERLAKAICHLYAGRDGDALAVLIRGLSPNVDVPFLASRILRMPTQ